MDGTVDYRRILLVMGLADTPIAMIPIEDLIADRMGQYASGSAPEMREQARLLFQLNPDLDMAYLDRRIRDETAGDHGIDDLR